MRCPAFQNSPHNVPTCPLGLAHASRRFVAVTQDINVLALVKGSERYVFLFDDSRRAETLRTLGRYASNPELSFTWYDAAVLSQKVRQTAEEVANRSRFRLPQPSDHFEGDELG
jgi:hypothetical protein